MKDRHLVLIVDDEKKIRSIISDILKDEGYDILLAKDGNEALNQLDNNPVDLILLDLRLPGMDGLEVIRQIQKRNKNPEIILISGHADIKTAVEAVRLGAFDFIEKPIELDRLLIAVTNSLKQKTLSEENIELKEGIKSRYRIIGESKAIKETGHFINISAKTDARILITGENGSGKDLVAHNIHLNSNRAEKPFIMVNCAAIPEHLFESELFGHEKGSFTGAISKQKGKFEIADSGTLFLNEIAEISLEMQSKLLQAIEYGEITPLGSSQTKIIDVRLISATNKDILQCVKDGQFREDLYYRLNVLHVTVPPLRARENDVILLAEHFNEINSVKLNVPAKQFSDEARAMLLSHKWPGNVREIAHFIEKLIILENEQIITAQILNKYFNGKLSCTRTASSGNGFDFKDARKNWEKDFLQAALDKNDWSITKTSKSIGLERSYLHRLVKQLELSRFERE